MKIQTEQAKVYRGGGRRYFTKRAAACAEARAAIFRRHPCDCDRGFHGRDYSPFICHLHAMDADRYHKIVRRVARLYLKDAE